MSKFNCVLRAVSAAVLLAAGVLASAPNRAEAIAPVQRIVSPGGIEALLIESHEVGVISLRFSFKGGAVQEPAGKEGVAFLTSFLFNEGAGDLSPQELIRHLARIGAGFAGSASSESFDVNLSMPSSERAEAIRLLKLALHAPRFDAEPFERARRSALASLEQETIDPGSMAMRRLSQMLYTGTRYTLPVHGTPGSVAALTAQDVRDYRARMFARDNLRVAVAGDIAAGELAKLLDEVFGALPARADVLAEPSIKPVTPQEQSIAMDMPQTLVLFGNNLPVLSAREDLAANVFNQVLSSMFTGRLFVALREREGLVYTIGTMRGRMSQAGTFWGSFGAAPQNVARAKVLAMTEIERLASEGPTEQELKDAKAALRGSYYLTLDTSANLSAVLMNMLDANRPDTFLRDFDAEVGGITIEEVRAVGRKLARPEDMVGVTIGRRDEAAAGTAMP